MDDLSREVVCCVWSDDNGTSIRYCGPRNDAIFRVMCKGYLYEQRMLLWIRDHLPTDLVFVDVGAHMGGHTLFFAIACKAAKVYAFEPHPVLFGILQINISINKAANVVASQLALGSTLGKARLVPAKSGDMGGSHIEMVANGSTQVVSLDLVIRGPVDVVKIDAEGSSLAILRGARHTLIQSKPDLFVECGMSDDFTAIDDFLRTLGYVEDQCFNPTPTYLYVHPGASRVKEQLA